MKTIHIKQTSLRGTAPASCFAQATGGMVRKDWLLSGRTTE